MAQYIRKDKRKGKEYYWLVESHREGKRVVQKRVKYLGTQKPADLATAIASKGAVRTKKEKATTITDKKDTGTKPVVPSTTAEGDGLEWLLG